MGLNGTHTPFGANGAIGGNGRDSRAHGAGDWETPDWSLLQQGRRPAPALPLDVFGKWGIWLKGAAGATSAPIDYIAASLLTCAGALIGNSCVIRPEPNNSEWEEPPTQWSSLLGPPSSGKTPALAIFEKVLAEIEAEKRAAFEPELQDYQAKVYLAEQAEKAWQENSKQAFKDKKSPPDRPLEATPPPEVGPPRIVVRSTTFEALAKLLIFSPKGVLALHDELAGWFNDQTRYSGSSDRPHHLSTYNGRSITMDRVKFNGIPLRVPRALQSILGGIQPARLAEVLESPEDGLTSRFNYYWPDPAPLERSKQGADIEALARALKRLSDLEMIPGPNGDPQSTPMTFTEDAAIAFFEFRRRIHEMLEAEEGHMAGWIGKGPGCVARIAGILALLDWTRRANAPQPRIVPLQTVERAMLLWLEYLLPMARRAFGDAARPEDEKKAIRLLKEIRRRRELKINERQIYRDWKLTGLRKADDLKPILAHLMEAGWVLPKPSREGESHGKPKGDWIINPELLA
jgi:hypothetical protein